MVAIVELSLLVVVTGLLITDDLLTIANWFIK